MSSGKKEVSVWKRIFDLWASIVKMVQNKARSPEWLANRLQTLVNEFVPMKFEHYFHPKQKEQGGWVGGFEFDKHLRETSRFECTRSLEDEEVKGWLENPETYPEEYRNKAIFLWKSLRDSGDVRYVAYLVWFSGRVFVRWRWLEGGWCGYDPVLLASSSDV